MAPRDDLLSVQTTLAAALPGWRQELETLIAIPSVSFPGFDPGAVRDSADAVAGLMRKAGLDAVRLLEVAQAPPAVYGERRVADDAPTVLLYAHHDVQPPGDEAAWTSPPFTPTERNGRLYGRGAADDKAGVVAHLAAVAAWVEATGDVPVNVKVFIEGEEEVGSPHLAAFLDNFGVDLAADHFVIADLVNWKVGVPSLTYLLRGLVDCEVEVRSLERGVHSGMAGPVPDPLTALAKLIAGLTDERGTVAVPALRAGIAPVTDAERERIEALDWRESEWRQEVGLLDGVPLTGDPDLHPLLRAWREPSLTVLGIDAPPVASASNTVQPAARAKLSLRLAPGQDPGAVLSALTAHLQNAAPMGVQVTVVEGAAASPFEGDLTGTAAEAAIEALSRAYGHEPALIGAGGSIPMLEPLQQRFPDASMLLIGVEDPDSRAHGIDESLHLGDWASACTAVAHLLGLLAR